LGFSEQRGGLMLGHHGGTPSDGFIALGFANLVDADDGA